VAPSQALVHDVISQKSKPKYLLEEYYLLVYRSSTDVSEELATTIFKVEE
jgi:hypothetical protein